MFSEFVPWPFWLKPFLSNSALLSRVAEGCQWSFASRQVVVFHAAQRMEHHPGARWMVAAHQGSSSAIDEVASQRSSALEAPSKDPPEFTSHPRARVQSPWTGARGSRVRRQGSSGEIGGRNGSSGETDPTFGHPQEALKTAKAQCQVRLVDRIASTKDFIERARKRIVACPSRSQSSAGGSCQGPSRSCTRKSKA